jgi:chromate transporter
VPVWLDMFLVFASLSLVAVGGANVLAPEMHRLLVDQRHLMDEATFAQLLALAQAAPGPNILSGSIMGYWIGGVPGLLGATFGLLGPTAVVAWLVAGLTRRLAHAPWLKPAQAGLVPLALGLVGASGLVMAQAASGGLVMAPVITLAATLFVWLAPQSPLWALAAGGLVGLLVL